MKRIGIITSGGDAPGTNACIRTIARRCFNAGLIPMGIFDAWDGLLKDNVRKLTRDDVAGIVQRAGTILRSARSRLFLKPGDADIARAALAKHGIDALVVVGGNGSQAAAAILAESGFPVIGVPKTIDNDLAGTDQSVGFATAVEVATAALDNLRATAQASNRVMVLEVMGRSAGWIAVESGIAGGADLVLIPEFPFTLDEICARLKTRHETHRRNYSIVVIAEGAMDGAKLLAPDSAVTDRLGRPRQGGVGLALAAQIESRLGFESRCTTLGYLQRSAAPCAQDRIIATRMSDAAFEWLAAGKSGLLAGMRGGTVASTPLRDVAGKVNHVTAEHYRLAALFG